MMIVNFLRKKKKGDEKRKSEIKQGKERNRGDLVIYFFL